MSTYTIGQPVQHRFGNGIVTNISGDFMYVEFPNIGTEKFRMETFDINCDCEYDDDDTQYTPTIPTAADIYHGCTGVWEPAYANMMAEIAAVATGAAADIAAKARKYHNISMAQSAVLAGVAKSNNITF